MPESAKLLHPNPFDDEAPTTQRAKVLDLTEELEIDLSDVLEDDEPADTLVDDGFLSMPPMPGSR